MGKPIEALINVCCSVWAVQVGVIVPARSELMTNAVSFVFEAEPKNVTWIKYLKQGEIVTHVFGCGQKLVSGSKLFIA